MAERTSWNEAQEMIMYRPGQQVEIKQRPGMLDTIIAYDPMMVPPVRLANDPQPRYPEELVLRTPPSIGFGWLQPRPSFATKSTIVPSRHPIEA